MSPPPTYRGRIRSSISLRSISCPHPQLLFTRRRYLAAADVFEVTNPVQCVHHACRQPVVSCFCHWRLSEDQNIEHYINSRVNCNSKLIINMKSKIQNQCLVKFSLMQVILTNFPHKILRCMSTSIDRLPTGVVPTPAGMRQKLNPIKRSGKQ